MKTTTRIVMYTALIASFALLCAIVSECHAYTSETLCRHVPGIGHKCSTVASDPLPEKKPELVMPLTKQERRELALEMAAREERIAKWEEFCKPVGTADAYGVIRLSYAHKGCEFGRAQ